jgi:hypothetical protein
MLKGERDRKSDITQKQKETETMTKMEKRISSFQTSFVLLQKDTPIFLKQNRGFIRSYTMWNS